VSTIPTKFQPPQKGVDLTTADRKASPDFYNWLIQLLGRLGLNQAQTANTFFGAPSTGAGPPSFRTIVAGDLPGLTVVITTAKLTGGGSNGSMTFTNGILTAQTQAT